MLRRTKPTKGKGQGKRASARKSPKTADARVRELEDRLAEALKRESDALSQLQTRNRELVEAREQLTATHALVTESHDQQTATSEILRVISSSPTDIQPVMDAVAENAARLCGADDAVIRRTDGDVIRLAAHVGLIPMSVERTMPIRRDFVAGRAALDGASIHIHDMQEERTRREYPGSAER